MKYVLQEAAGPQKKYYVYSDKYIHLLLSKAKLFKNRNVIKTFQNKNYWCNTYVIVKVTNKQLFEARLKGV